MNKARRYFWELSEHSASNFVRGEHQWLQVILQERCHVNWKQKSFFILFQILGVNQITSFYFLAEDIKQFVSLVTRRFNLNRINLCASWEAEINLIIVIFVFWPCIVEQLVTWSCQHLCNNILIDKAQIGTLFVILQFLLDDVLRMVFVPKCKCYEQAGVCTKIEDKQKVFYKELEN